MCTETNRRLNVRFHRRFVFRRRRENTSTSRTLIRAGVEEEKKKKAARQREWMVVGEDPKRRRKKNFNAIIIFFMLLMPHDSVSLARTAIGASRSVPCSPDYRPDCHLAQAPSRGREMPLILHFQCLHCARRVALESNFESPCARSFKQHTTTKKKGQKSVRCLGVGTIFIATTTEKMFSHLFLWFFSSSCSPFAFCLYRSFRIFFFHSLAFSLAPTRIIHHILAHSQTRPANNKFLVLDDCWDARRGKGKKIKNSSCFSFLWHSIQFFMNLLPSTPEYTNGKSDPKKCLSRSLKMRRERKGRCALACVGVGDEIYRSWRCCLPFLLRIPDSSSSS